MSTVSALSRAELGRRLAGTGLRLRTGAFVTSIRSTIPSVGDGIDLLYSDYALAGDDILADFHLALNRRGGLRRWIRPQVDFDYDGVRPFQPLPLDQAFPLLEWGMNYCVSTAAHRYLIIHAAVVERHGQAAILPAPPGSGKSTLCAALVSRGWRLLSDELAMVRLDTGELVPLPRPISLKNASIDIIRHYAPTAVFSRAVADTVKGTVAHMKVPALSVARAAQPARAAWIVFPQYQAGAAPLLEPIAPAQAFMRTAENAFNYSLLGVAGFDAMAALIDSSRSFRFSYSALDDAIDVFSRLAPAP
jgi:HprK-related kinase A